MKDPYSSGYISPHMPHAINNILVDDLGRDEVLLLVTDSGNVCGYRVEAIFSALKRAAERKENRPFDGSQVLPFFVEYVEASAWGLAIHKFSRLIAVTANTGLVTVFAFALVNHASRKGSDTGQVLSEEEEFTDYGQTWLEIKSDEQFKQLQHLMPAKHRNQNIRLTYTGHFTNIPSVSFLNCDLDPNGTWMVSTDIENQVFVWKTWEGPGPFNVYHFGDASFRYPETFNHDTRQSTSHAVYDGLSAECRRADEAPEPSDTQDVRNLRPSDSADAFSHRAVDGSVLEDNLSSNASSDGESYTGLQQNSSQEGETQGGNGTFHRVDDTEHTDNTPSHGPLTTPEFLQVALLEALGGDIPGAEEYFDDYSIEEVSPFEDIEMDGADDDISESDDTSTSEAVAYQVFNRMSRGAFPSDPSIYGQRESLIDFSSTPAPTHANFPILHFSQTDIRLIPNPLAPRATVFCGTPLRQQFTHIVGSLRDACDRFNMVKYIPEHGIVVAASQKGRAAVITLTESEANGLSFRVDWIVPFESQEKYGDRPLIPLLGMSVGPMQGFEMPPDVPNIPHDANGGGLKFHYEPTTNDELDARLQNSSKSSDILGEDLRPPYEACGTRVSRESTPTVSTQVDTIPEQEQQTFPTLPECHARATRAYQPEETWRGWNPSRRYRLLLLFADHTVLSYEFWYNWSPTGTADDESDEEGYLVV
ncbi:hypothetical protein APSETT444_006706 [Aspergillus pseudonomiae]